MIPVRVIATPEVVYQTKGAVFFGIDDLVREITGQPANCWDVSDDDFHVISHAWDPSQNILDMDLLHAPVENIPGKHDEDPHISVIATTARLVCKTQNAAGFYGIADSRTAVVSAAAFMGIANRPVYHHIVQQVAAHEFGHLLGLTERDHDTYIDGGPHCTNPECVMHQPPDWFEAVKRRLANGRYLCDVCLAEAKIDKHSILKYPFL